VTTMTTRSTDPVASESMAGANPWRRLFGSLRSSGLLMVIALIAVVLEASTNGLFLSPRNLTNLAVAAAVTAILASGTVPIMVTGNIDLAPTAAVAMTGLAVAWLGTKAEQGIAVTILGALGLGLLIGLWHGVWIVFGRVPSFIVTLGSLLGLGGLAIALTSGQTLPVSPGVVEISAAVVPPVITAVVGALLVAGTALFALQNHAARKVGRSPASMTRDVVVPTVKVAAVMVAVLAVATSYQGFPLPVAIVVVVATAVNIWTKYTPSGRKLYAIGGNPRAAVLAGIRTGRYVMAAFLVQGLFYGIAGILSVSYVASASPSGQTGLELAVITAAVIGGTSLFGGVGTVFGALLGTLLTASLQNGLQLRNVDGSYVQIIIAFVLLVAVFIDIRARASAST
jgi:D-xylose transport system permease protein